jgi:hypothetical protein
MIEVVHALVYWVKAVRGGEQARRASNVRHAMPSQFLAAVARMGARRNALAGNRLPHAAAGVERST